MKTKMIFLAAVLFLSSVVPAFAEEKAKEESQKEISNTYHASCILKITASPEILPAEGIKTIEYILQSSPVGGKAAREILGVHPDPLNPAPFGENIEVLLLSSIKISENSSTYTIRLLCHFPDVQTPAVEEFMFAIIEQLRLYLEKEYEQYFQRLELNMKAASENTIKAEVELRSLQSRLRDISGSFNLDRKAILENIANLQNELGGIEKRMKEADFMVNELSRQIAEASAKIDSALYNDVVLKELETILSSQQKSFDSVNKLVETGAANSSQLFEAEEKLARAKIDIAQRKELIRKSAGGEKIEMLNQRIDDISMRKQQDMIVRETIDQQLGLAQNLLGRVDEYEIVGLKTDVAKEAYQRSIWSESELKAKMSLSSLIPTTITIVGYE